MTIKDSDARARFEEWIKDKDNATIGGLIREYIAESNHGGWNGYTHRNLTGVRAFLIDLMLYHDSQVKGRPADERMRIGKVP